MSFFKRRREERWDREAKARRETRERMAREADANLEPYQGLPSIGDFERLIYIALRGQVSWDEIMGSLVTALKDLDKS